MADETNTEFNERKSQEQMVRDIHLFIVGGIRQGRHVKGLAAMVEDHEEKLYGKGQDAGLIQAAGEWKKAKIQVYTLAGLIGFLTHFGGKGLSALASIFSSGPSNPPGH